LWQGSFEEIEENWLRWYDTEGNCISTDTEYMQQQLERERQGAIWLSPHPSFFTQGKPSSCGFMPSGVGGLSCIARKLI